MNDRIKTNQETQIPPSTDTVSSHFIVLQDFIHLFDYLDLFNGHEFHQNQCPKLTVPVVN